MKRRMKKVYLVAGFILTALAAIGLFLPLLPTTPLLLLAASCFAEGSERWHRWLLEHRTFGPVIRSWQDHRCIPRRTKTVAILVLLVFGGYAVGFAIDGPYLRAAGALLVLTGLIVILRIRACDGRD